VLQNLYDPTKSIYRALEDANQATQLSSKVLQQPQTVVFAPFLYENYFIGKVCNFASVILPSMMGLPCDRRMTDWLKTKILLCIGNSATVSAKQTRACSHSIV